jgi:hypothetical protein
MERGKLQDAALVWMSDPLHTVRVGQKSTKFFLHMGFSWLKFSDMLAGSGSHLDLDAWYVQQFELYESTRTTKVPASRRAFVRTGKTSGSNNADAERMGSYQPKGIAATVALQCTEIVLRKQTRHRGTRTHPAQNNPRSSLSEDALPRRPFDHTGRPECGTRPVPTYAV